MSKSYILIHQIEWFLDTDEMVVSVRRTLSPPLRLLLALFSNCFLGFSIVAFLAFGQNRK